MINFGANLRLRAFFLGDRALQLVAQDRALTPELAQALARYAEELRVLTMVTAAVPSFDSVTLWLTPNADPQQVLHAAQLAAHEFLAATPQPKQHHIICRRDLLDDEFRQDLARLAKHANCTEQAWLQQFCSHRYTVACIGFKPGFPYLLGLPNNLAMPRRASPRVRVPAGAVAVGGEFTGVYPTASPGGWHIVAITDVVLFDAHRASPCLLGVGDQVQFTLS